MLRKFICFSFLLLMCANLVHADLAQSQLFIQAELTKINAQLIAEQQEQSSVKTYPLSNLQRVSNQVRAKDELELQGLWRSLTYELPAKHQLQNMIQEVLRSCYQQDGLILTWCENRECGSSALWANYVFSQPRLNGLDDAQSYALVLVADNVQEKPPILIAMYGIKRGNQRSYVHIELIQTDDVSYVNLAPNASTLLKILQHFCEAEGCKLPPQVNNAWASSISGALEIDNTISFIIDGDGADLWRTKLQSLIKNIGRIDFTELNQSKNNALTIKIKE